MKEDLLRINQVVFGARYLFDFIQPGGVAADLPDDARRSAAESLPGNGKRSFRFTRNF